LIVDAVELYTNSIQPRANEIMNKKYAYNGVEYNIDDNTFHLIQLSITNENLEWDLTEGGQKVVSFRVGVEQEKRKRVKNVAFSEAIPEINSKLKDSDEEMEKPEKFKLKPQLKLQEDEEEEEQEEEKKDDSDVSDSDEDNDELPLPKITIYPNLLSDGTIAASEAHRMGMKIELVKGELIAKNEKTGETYKVTAGQG
jgi:hypothetical protein